MAQISLLDSARERLIDAWHERALILKAVIFALIGLVNSAVDYGVFLLARMALSHSPAALSLFDVIAAHCRCGAPATLLLIAANMMSWSVAVSGSYILNSSITFAAESGRKLSVRHYFTFVISGIAGLVANTAALVFVAQILGLPIWAAKGASVLTAFVVNFSLSHFYIFRVRPEPAAGNAEGV